MEKKMETIILVYIGAGLYFGLFFSFPYCFVENHNSRSFSKSLKDNPVHDYMDPFLHS